MEAINLVTIIIPTFNRANKLPDAIESAISQSYKNTQIIVIDDGSTDDTKELVKKYPQVEYHYQENRGQASARNKGLSYAKGSIVASLDSDDVWYEKYLEINVSKLVDDNLDFVFANWDQDSKIGEPWNFLLHDPFLKPYFSKEKDHWIDLEYNELRDLYIKACPSPSSSVVIRKSSLLTGWDESIKIGDDWSMYLEMILSKECHVAFTMQKLWRKRVDDINIYDGRKWSEILEHLHIHDLKKNIVKFKHLMSKSELRILEERYMVALVELSKHNIIRERNFATSLKLLKTSLDVDFGFTLKALPAVFLTGLQRKVDGIRKKKK